MSKVLIARQNWDTSKGQIFYELTSVSVDNPERFVELIKKLQYVPLLVGEYDEMRTDVPTGGYDWDGEPYYHCVAYLQTTEKDFINNILEAEKEYGIFEDEANIVREYIRTC